MNKSIKKLIFYLFSLAIITAQKPVKINGVTAANIQKVSGLSKD